MAIYLHFLDRELRSSVKQDFTSHQYLAATAAALLCTTDTLYAGLSLVFETGAQDMSLHSALLSLIQTRHFQPVSHHPTLDEFLETRRTLYQHDAARYPTYFGADAEALQEQGLDIVYKESSVTTSLVEDLASVVSDFGPVEEAHTLGPAIDKKAVINAIERGLAERGQKAVTYAAFSPTLGDESPVQNHYLIRRLISEYYTAHYMHHLSADLITGLPGISYYDNLAVGFPVFDYSLWSTVFSMAAGRDFQDPEVYRGILNVCGWRGSPEHQTFVLHLRRLLVAASYMTGTAGPKTGTSLRNQIRDFITHILANITTHRPPQEILDWAQFCNTASMLLTQAMERRSRTDRDFQIAINNTQAIEDGMKTRILICTAADIEAQTLEARLKTIGLNATPKFDGSFSYWDYGERQNCRIFATQSQAGSGGSGGATLTVDDGIRALAPNFIISLGIAFGKSPEKQKIGDILVSRQIQDYERVRAGKDGPIGRGDKTPAHAVLYNRCDVAKASWTRCAIHTGLLLSGEKLVDDPKLKEYLWGLFPEAIGGEMEGAGISSACNRRQKPCIVIKAICDWGEDKGDADQPLAAQHAVDFFIHILEEGGWSDFGLQATPTTI